MQGASRAAMAEARERLAAAVADPSAAATIGDELFAVATLLDGEPGLRRALADPATAASARAGLARALLESRIAPATLDLVATMAGLRWSAPGDLPDAAEQLAVLAMSAAADSEGQLDDLEDELFRFGRIVGTEPGLRSALADQELPAEGKRGLLAALLAGKVTPAALGLITQAAVHPRGRSLDASLAEYGRLAADWQQRLIALVRVASELTPSQRLRLTESLSAIYGRDVHLNIVIDPAVVGGMSVQIGDEFLDGSVGSRLAQLRRRLAA
ncbi:MAG TPA: F0F1 ATP synthase subunit delta [Streptosporangiaceae bacterium]|nr:F0F1 ATP synthase subunit delta [Streptosporangiaceae bacterium]